MTSLIKTWGTQDHERRLYFPCDRFIEKPFDALYRGITVKAPPGHMFKWLCQMRIAPYSYDWIDNFGRQSPQDLIPGLDKLEIGQTVMVMFSLVDFARNEHLTIRTNPDRPESKIFGDVAVSYCIHAQKNENCRLLVKLAIKYPNGIPGRLMRFILPLGDLIMMRKQLLNFKKLSERMKDEA